MSKIDTYLQPSAIIPVTIESVRQLHATAQHYRDEYMDLLEIVQAAIKAKDWIVDGACDPDRHLQNFRKQSKVLG